MGWIIRTRQKNGHMQFNVFSTITMGYMVGWKTEEEISAWWQSSIAAERSYYEKNGLPVPEFMDPEIVRKSVVALLKKARDFGTSDDYENEQNAYLKKAEKDRIASRAREQAFKEWRKGRSCDCLQYRNGGTCGGEKTPCLHMLKEFSNSTKGER